MTFDVYADLAEYRRDRVTQVDQRIHRRDGNVAFFRTNVVAVVGRVFARASRIPVAFFGINGEPRRVLVVVETGFVKNEELGLGADIDRIGDTGEFQIALSPDRDRPRIESVPV